MIDFADATARFSELVDRAEAGETIVIARNGKPVAELRPLQCELIRTLQLEAIAELETHNGPADPERVAYYRRLSNI